MQIIRKLFLKIRGVDNSATVCYIALIFLYTPFYTGHCNETNEGHAVINDININIQISMDFLKISKYGSAMSIAQYKLEA